jgi:hypothetical protein
MVPKHRMALEASNGEELLFACTEESCGRRVVLDRRGDVVVIDHGEFFASHEGTVGPISLSVRPGP